MIPRIKGTEIQLFIEGERVPTMGDFSAAFEVKLDGDDYLGEVTARAALPDKVTFTAQAAHGGWEKFVAGILSRQAIDRAMGWIAGSMEPWRMLPDPHDCDLDCYHAAAIGELAASFQQAVDDGDINTADLILALAARVDLDLGDHEADLLERLTAP